MFRFISELKTIKIAIFKLSKLGVRATKPQQTQQQQQPPTNDKMVGNNNTMIAIRLVRSKLRKREEHSNSVHPATTEVVLQTQTAPATQNNTNNTPADPLAYRGQFLWQYPPPPPLPQVYSNDQVSPNILFTFLLLKLYILQILLNPTFKSI